MYKFYILYIKVIKILSIYKVHIINLDLTMFVKDVVNFYVHKENKKKYHLKKSIIQLACPIIEEVLSQDLIYHVRIKKLYKVLL